MLYNRITNRILLSKCERIRLLGLFMIKSDYKKDETKASLKRLLDEEAVAEIGAAGLLDSDVLNSLGMVAMTARSEIPPAHRRIADSYLLKKKIYGNPVIRGQITQEEKLLLMKYDFNRLELSTIRQINEELAFLQQASVSLDRNLRVDSEKILEIRSRELTFLAATKFSVITSEIFNGYMAIEEYFNLVSSYAKPSKPGSRHL